MDGSRERENLLSYIKGGEILDQLINHEFLKEDPAPWNMSFCE
jgi:hypothetical protein